MKIFSLIKELQKYDGNTEVAIYAEPSITALWIPNYNPDSMVAPDEDLASEYGFPKDTVFILGK